MPIKNVTTVYEDITGADVSSIALQNQGGNHLEIMASTGPVPDPSEVGFLLGAISNDTGVGKVLPTTLEALFPSISGATRLYVRSTDGQPGRLWYSALLTIGLG